MSITRQTLNKIEVLKKFINDWHNNNFGRIPISADTDI